MKHSLSAVFWFPTGSVSVALFIPRRRPGSKSVCVWTKKSMSTAWLWSLYGFSCFRPDSWAWDAPGRHEHGGTIATGYQAVGSTTKHKELGKSGPEGWSSITAEFRVAHMA